MAVTPPFRRSVSVILFTIFLNFGLSQSLRRPQILAKYETILEPGQNFTVTCAGNSPLTWTVPEVKISPYDDWTKIDIQDEVPMEERFTHASTLTIENITYPFTGFYHCHSKDASPADETRSSKIYLFVRDEEHLAVDEQEVITIEVTQYSNAVIPCRPTSPDVTVELSLITGEKVPDTTYDPKTGFTFYVDRLSSEGAHVCLYSRGDLEFETYPYLKVFPVTHSLAKPLLEELSGGHTVVGTPLVLVCKIRTNFNIYINWRTPNGGPPDLDRMIVSNLSRDSQDAGITLQKLTIKEARLTDKGTYHCDAKDNQNHSNTNSINVTVYDKHEHFISLQEDNGVYTIPAEAGMGMVRWSISVKGHPQPEVSWFNNMNENITSVKNHKYSTTISPSVATLEIYDISITDFGNYTLMASNEFETQKLNLFLNVTDKPSVHIESKDFHPIGRPSVVRCLIAAYPQPSVYWYFKRCQDSSCYFEPIKAFKSEKNGLQLISYVNITASQSGYVKCVANNSLGEDEAVQGYYVSDVDDGLDIFGLDSSVYVDSNKKQIKIAKGETLSMTCGASIFNYTDRITWYHDEKPIGNDNRNTVEKSHTDYTNRVRLAIPEVTVRDGGLYSCRVENKYDGDYVYENVSVMVMEPAFPAINDTNLNREFVMNLPHKLELYCYISGIPKPTITWYKNDRIFVPSNRVQQLDEKQRIKFLYTDASDEGTYKCEAGNKLGRVARQAALKFKNKPSDPIIWIIPLVGFLIIIIIVISIFFIIRERNARKLRRELKRAGLANFEKGNIENLNPELGIDDQAELLPYDRKWEFPIERLKLGKQLGSGAFGVVMKGVARGIVDGEESTTVAVKMVKKNADYVYIKALASELKIMVHLGKHLNVVNLLGACTKNVVKRELLVIVEYCRFGNLHNYLLRQREYFIDQIDRKTGQIDYTIGQEYLERTYSVSSNRSNPQSPQMKYAALAFSSSNNSGGGGAGNNQVPTEMADYRGPNYSGGANTGKTETTMISTNPNANGEEGPVLSNNSIQPEWRSNYKADYKGQVRPVCTKDLLAWAFQVSRGMEYLASRKVMHGDLAARNILLADNDVVKICDFGLAKSMYKNDNYKKRGDGPLPVKWMAVESIRDRIFSTQSDVWSFGIVLWEFFSLARTPYPGMEADERLYNKLVDGYRMEAPEYAPKEVYKMMLDCWKPKPQMRPTFTRIAERIGSMLEDTVRKHYIDLNDPYLVMNTQRLEDGRSDYLAMVSPPNFENLSTPHNYVNEDIVVPLSSPPLSPSSEGEQHENTAPSGYLCMKPQTIFSPRPDEGRVFDFSVANGNNKNRNNKERGSAEGSQNEMLPMLGLHPGSAGTGGNESDYDSSVCNSPKTPIVSFSNPSYHHLSPTTLTERQTTPEKDPRRSPIRIEEENELEKDILKTPDNYVNMPQNKTAIINKEKNSSYPFIKIDVDDNNSKKDGGVHYVNSNSRDWESVIV